jgi:hypothetical protein
MSSLFSFVLKEVEVVARHFLEISCWLLLVSFLKTASNKIEDVESADLFIKRDPHAWSLSAFGIGHRASANFGRTVRLEDFWEKAMMITQRSSARAAPMMIPLVERRFFTVPSRVVQKNSRRITRTSASCSSTIGEAIFCPPCLVRS